ncbi:MAG TPA: hypothetical protein VGD64_08245 [Acidisarcina sp.]
MKKYSGGCKVWGRLSAAGFVLALMLVVMGGEISSQAQSAPVYTPPVVAPNDTLSGIKYDSRWEFYGGPAYAHFDAGPNLLQGANLGGLDVQAARWSTRKWAAVGNLRAYLGTSGAVPNPYNIRGPFVAEFFALAGPEYRGPGNEHVSMTFHALAGAVYGLFDKALKTVPPATVGFYNNQYAFGAALGGSIDLNRSQKLAFRISPDATLTNFGSNGIKEQFALSVGIVYRLGHIPPR